MAGALSPLSDFPLDSQARTFVRINFKIVFTAFQGRCSFKAASGSTNVAPRHASRTGGAPAELRMKEKKKRGRRG